MFDLWNICFGQGQLSGEERRGGGKSVQGEREETKAEVWGKRLHRIRREAERTGRKDKVEKRGHTGKRVLNVEENRTSLEGNSGTGAGSEGQGTRAPLGA